MHVLGLVVVLVIAGFVFFGVLDDGPNEKPNRALLYGVLASFLAMLASVFLFIANALLALPAYVLILLGFIRPLRRLV